MKVIIIEVPDEFEIKIEICKDSKVYIEDGENKLCYAEFEESGVYKLSKNKDDCFVMSTDDARVIAGHISSVTIDGKIEPIEHTGKPKKKEKSHPNPYLRKFKTGFR